MIRPIIILLSLAALACSDSPEIDLSHPVKCDACNFTLSEYYKLKSRDTLPSQAIGSVGNGKLKHGKILPPKGENFFYFDSTSYMADRAFTHQITKNILLNTFDSLNSLHPEKTFVVMEASNKKGGKMHPHRTHQNGLSIDLMYPKLRNGKNYEFLDTLGVQHYLLDFDKNGLLSTDKNVSIDFELTAKHIYLLSQEAKKQNARIEKVIMYTEFKDELFATTYGKKLKSEGIYFAQKLSKTINKLHDDHFHIDFSLN